MKLKEVDNMRNSFNGYINFNTYQLLFDDIEIKESNSFENKDNYLARTAIEVFNKLNKIEEKKIFINLYKLLLGSRKICLDKIIFNEKTKEYEYHDGDYVITFDKLSNYIDNLGLKIELLSNKRYHKCHERSYALAPVIEHSRIVTGYITRNHTKVLHSVIEIPKNDKIIIMDWTMNLYIEKEQYVALNDFIELSSFEGKKVIDDIEKIAGNLEIGLKPYLVFRNELMKDMERNPHIFQTTTQGKRITQEIRENIEVREAMVRKRSK